MKRKKALRFLLWFGAVGVVIVAISVALWVHRFQRYTPIEVIHDVRAGVAARKAPKPFERFLELRYGPLTDAAVRQKAFLDFFNVGHIQGLQLLVSHMTGPEQKANIAATAEWIANYRQTMSPAERQALGDRVRSSDGSAMLQRATAKYLSQDVYYRAQTAPVISELMATLAEVKNH